MVYVVVSGPPGSTQVTTELWLLQIPRCFNDDWLLSVPATPVPDKLPLKLGFKFCLLNYNSLICISLKKKYSEQLRSTLPTSMFSPCWTHTNEEDTQKLPRLKKSDKLNVQICLLRQTECIRGFVPRNVFSVYRLCIKGTLWSCLSTCRVVLWDGRTLSFSDNFRDTRKTNWFKDHLFILFLSPALIGHTWFRIFSAPHLILISSLSGLR